MFRTHTNPPDTQPLTTAFFLGIKRPVCGGIIHPNLAPGLKKSIAVTLLRFGLSLLGML
jgi:hypothetical protein